MQATKIIIAEATSSSSEDDYGRVSIKAEDIYNGTEKLIVLGEMSIVKGDQVLVDISQGYECPAIIGVLKQKSSDYDYQLFHSSNSDKTAWSKCLVSKNKVTLTTSDSVKIEVTDKGGITIDSGKSQSVIINNHLKVL